MIEEFKQLTIKLLALDIEEENTIDRIEKLIEERENLISEIKEIDGVISDEDILEIMQLNNQVGVKLEEVILKLKTNINSVFNEKTKSSIKKKANRSYSNIGYQNNGYFIDKKK
jgi:23S rRNA U2552 (ribose-2'-O)-methylase RlmE/FtsJ